MDDFGLGSTDWDMKMRLGADRVLRAVARLRRQPVVVMASAALAVVATARPDLLPPELATLATLLNINAIHDLLKAAADESSPDDEELAARMEQLLPAHDALERPAHDALERPAHDALERPATGQKDMLRVLTKQYRWQQQMLRLQEADAAAGAQLLAETARMTGDLAAIRDAIGASATQAQMDALLRLITDRVLPQLDDAAREKYNLSGDFRGAMVNINSTVTIAWPEDKPWVPPSPPAAGELPRPDHLPPGSRIPFDRNSFFTGRGGELLALAALLLPGVGGGAAVVSSGIGGMGKTQLAVEFAWRFGRFFHGVHWVSAENPEAAGATVAECGRRMRLHPAFGDLPLPDQVALTLDKWSGPEARLLIFDNCEEPGLLAQWRPKGGGARLLVTSRNAVWPPHLGVSRRALDALPAEQAVALLEAYLTADGRPPTAADPADPTAELAALAAELGGLPLALHLAGSYLESYAGDPKGTPAALLAELRDPALMLRGAALTGRAAVDSPTGHDPHVANTFLLSLRALERKAPDVALAMALLACAACLAPGEPFPAALLRATIDEGIDSLDVSDALRALEQVGLLERAGSAAEAATPGGACRLHRLIGRFVAGELAGEMAAARGAVERAISKLAYEHNMAGDPRMLREWEIHLRHVTDGAFEREDDDAAALCANLGYYLQMNGDLAGARPYYERALAIRERVLGPEHPATATSLNNLGYLLRAQGDLAGARPYYERALAIRERVLGPEHPDTAQSLNSMGVLLSSMGDLVGARPYFERALVIRERVLGPDHPDTAQSLNNMGVLLQAMGDLTAARPYYERALAVRERVLGPDHPNTALSLHNMGGLLRAMGDLPATRPYYERALAVYERVLGLDHPDTARSLNNMGYLLDSMGDLAAARPYYERALAVRERVLGPDHPDTAYSCNNLGTLFAYEGNFDEAVALVRRALAIREKALGPQHPLTRQARDNLAAIGAAMEGS